MLHACLLQATWHVINAMHHQDLVAVSAPLMFNNINIMMIIIIILLIQYYIVECLLKPCGCVSATEHD